MNYLVGPWLFIPSRFLISLSRTERELDPLSFKLLSYFVLNAERIIAREELVEKVWQQPFVDDNAINRAISELRKLLKHDDFQEQVIKTHYRKGYSLTVSVSLQPAREVSPARKFDNKPITEYASEKPLENADHPATQALATNSNIHDIPDSIQNENGDHLDLANSRKHKDAASTSDVVNHKSSTFYIVSCAVIGVCLITIVILSYYLWGMSKQDEQERPSYSIVKNSPKVTITAATWNIGGESNPVASSNGALFAYSNLRDNKVNSIVKRPLDQREVKLTYDNYNIGVLSWQPDSNKLLVQLSDISQLNCFYATFNLNDFPHVGEAQKIKRCDIRSSGYAQLSADGNFLYYAETANDHSGNALFRFNIAKQTSSLLIPSIKPGFGITHLKLSREGKNLAYLVSETGHTVKLFVYNLDTSENRLIYQVKENQISFAFDWSPDDKFLYLADRNIIHQISVDSGEILNIELPKDIVPFYLSVENNQQILVSLVDTQQYEIVKIANLFGNQDIDVEPLFESDTQNYYAIASKHQKNTVYYVSDRSGVFQIWQNKNGLNQQVSNFEPQKNQYLGSLVLSSQEDYLLFKRGKKLNFLDLKTNQTHAISELNAFKVGSYVWRKDSQGIYFTRLIDASSQIWYFDLRTRMSKPVDGKEGDGLVADEHGEVFYFSGNYLVRLNDFKRFELSLPKTSRFFNAINNGYLYSSDGIASIYRTQLISANGRVEEHRLPFNVRSISVSTDSAMLITKSVWKNTHIKRIIWQ